MHGTVLVRWEEGYEEAICVVSDLPQDQAKTAWYQMRFWIEDEYKDGKRGWFHWEQTKMTNPQRASRLWVVLAIVLHKAILLGGQLEAQEQRARHRSKRHQPGPKRRRGRPALSEGGVRGEGSKVCRLARNHGHAGSRVRRQEALAQRSGESRATALPLVRRETGV